MSKGSWQWCVWCRQMPVILNSYTAPGLYGDPTRHLPDMSCWVLLLAFPVVADEMPECLSPLAAGAWED